jgi:hypothetical protein
MTILEPSGFPILAQIVFNGELRSRLPDPASPDFINLRLFMMTLSVRV